MPRQQQSMMSYLTERTRRRTGDDAYRVDILLAMLRLLTLFPTTRQRLLDTLAHPLLAVAVAVDAKASEQVNHRTDDPTAAHQWLRRQQRSHWRRLVNRMSPSRSQVQRFQT